MKKLFVILVVFVMSFAFVGQVSAGDAKEADKPAVKCAVCAEKCECTAEKNCGDKKCECGKKAVKCDVKKDAKCGTKNADSKDKK